MDSFLAQKNIKIFHCENCDFSCYKESEWNRHIITRKHKMIDNDSEKTTEKIWKCKCGKIFCITHLHAEEHNCTYDYKQESQEYLKKTNVVCVASKVDKI